MSRRRDTAAPRIDPGDGAALHLAVADDAPPELAHGEALVRAAWLYYVEGMTQVEIARQLGSNRARVIAMLGAAREAGLVQVRIASRTAAAVALERALVARFGLREAVVVPSAIELAATPAMVGHAAGAWLANRLRDGAAIGIGWGRTLEMGLKAIGDDTAWRGLSVVSLLGSLPHSRALTPATVARRLADVLAADCYQLTAPMLVADPATRDALWREPALAALDRRAREVDVALVSVGDMGSDSTLAREGVVTRADLASLARAGAVGDVLGQFLDAQGRRVAHPVNRRVVAFDIEALARLPDVAIVSGGARKAQALKAALAAVRPQALITDEAAAEKLLALR